MTSEDLHTVYAQLVSKAQNENEAELYELAQLAGVTMDPEVFRIILDLLEMKCSPKDIVDVISSMIKHRSHSAHQRSQSHNLGHRDSSHSHHSSALKNISNPVLSSSTGQTQSSTLSMPSSKGSSSSKYGNRSRSSLFDENQSLLHSNITMRSQTKKGK